MNVEILVEGEGLADLAVIQLPVGASAREIVRFVGSKSGVSVDDALLFAEDDERPIDIACALIDESFSGRTHHVHRLPCVSTIVFYQQRHLEHAFSPAARVNRVLEWAVGCKGFNIDASIAPEMELALHGSDKVLPRNAHIGRYIQHPHHELKVDLVRGVIPNGAVR
jgi:hypothetical protein